MKPIIFLGPSLPLEEARGILDAIYLPPAGQTDFLTASVNRRPEIIGLIDGVFLQSLSIWHKEILYALDMGIAVYGASSMGALRAAEMSPFGMIGVGQIYRQYASGELIDDDEVALDYGPSELGYHKLSEPMVNVRATFEAATRAGVISEAERQQLNAIAKRIYFAERTFDSIFDAAARHGFQAGLVDDLSKFVQEQYVDIKRLDAIELLRTIAASKSTARRPRPPQLRGSAAFDALYNRDRRVDQNGTEVALESIGYFAALNDSDFDDLNFHALNRVTTYLLAEILGLTVGPEELDGECRRFRRRRAILDQTSFASWLDQMHLSLEEFRQLMLQVALCRRVHKWFIVASWQARTCKAILDELRLSGRYVQSAEGAATQERLLSTDSAHSQDEPKREVTLEDLLREHREWTGFHPDVDIEEWREEAGFHTRDNLKMELLRAHAARLALLKLLSVSLPAGSSDQKASDQAESAIEAMPE